MAIKIFKNTLLFTHFLCIFQAFVQGQHYDESNDRTRIPIYLMAGQNTGNIRDLKSLYVQKCSSCHSLSKSNYAKDILPSDWRDTISRMAALKNANISGTDQELIYDYLVYDSATRRKIKLDQQVLALPPAQQESEKANIIEVLRKYGQMN
ncbi:MAG: cytochrome c [Parachlamydiales bacterium]|jgi:Zn-finger protein